MLEGLLVFVLILWIFGFIGHVGGDLIHILLVLFLVGLVWRIYSGRSV